MAGTRYSNIDGSGFRRNRYIGHAHGVWHIKIAKNRRYWTAVHRDEPHNFPRLEARTLAEMSQKLLKINAPRYAT